MSIASEARRHEVLKGLKDSGFTVAALIGTMLALRAQHDGWGILVQDGCIVVSFGHVGEVHIGCPIVLNASFFKTNDVVRTLGPLPAANQKGRVGFVRLKRKAFDFAVVVAYPPPVDKHGHVRPVVNTVNKHIDFTISARSLTPNQCLPILALDAYGHVGLQHDRATRSWTSGLSDSIGEFDSER